MSNSAHVPNLEDRFLEPQGWRWGTFNNKSGAALRFGYLQPENAKPDAIIVLLPGRAEFIEKYFETVRDLAARNFAVWIMDWQGQGKSGRFPHHPERGQSPAFNAHVDDLHHFIMHHVKSAFPESSLAMLAHSMGGNIGLRYLHRYPGMFQCAAFTSPMLGIKSLSALPLPVSMALTSFLALLAGKSYAFGQKDWNPEDRIQEGAHLTTDPVRGKIHDSWMKHDPALQVGGVTFGWLSRAVASCLALHSAATLRSIQIPCLISLADNETLVDNDAIRRACHFLPHARLLELPGAGHEIMMERNQTRSVFLGAFYKIIDETNAKRP